MIGSSRAAWRRLDRVLLVRLLPLAWMLAIFALSSIESPRLAAEPLLDLALKKGGHLLLYAVLALLVAAAVSTTRASRWAAWLALAIALVFAVSDEFHQFLTPTRWPSWADVLIDGAGTAVGAALFVGWRRRARRIAA